MLGVALVITLAVPATSYFPLLLLVLADRLAAAWRRWHGPLRRGPVGGD